MTAKGDRFFPFEEAYGQKKREKTLTFSVSPIGHSRNFLSEFPLS
jgi:hypothetical protein